MGVIMRLSPKPIHRSGEKNIFCPFYTTCLDQAAKYYWQYWDCSECPHRLRKQAVVLHRNVEGLGPYCELPSRVSRHVRTGFLA